MEINRSSKHSGREYTRRAYKSRSVYDILVANATNIPSVADTGGRATKNRDISDIATTVVA